MEPCEVCGGTGLVVPTPVEHVLLERELQVRYGWVPLDPLRRPCDSCKNALYTALTSSALRMVLSAWAAVTAR